MLQFIDLGVVTSVEMNHKPVEFARKGQEVCIKIEPVPGEAPKMFGRHFDEKDLIISKVSLFFFNYSVQIFSQVWIQRGAIGTVASAPQWGKKCTCRQISV